MAQNTENRALNDKFMLRLPDGMRDRIKAAAERNNRSMNAEIVMALEYWLEADLPYELAVSAGAGPEDARRMGMEDWTERSEIIEDTFKQELERSIDFLNQLRRQLKVRHTKPESDD
ncbi:Arc family DNA-binding protein [Paracoccus methylovorus]|uniref:Arc family DNA-binding protein n=2 Tax=Paracoccus methylovorus TaxID=2812658 RepID=A0ABX7JQM2_9RHOB|nr:Arc family DNA-binding protein [Paracoccus methylovorus]